MMWKPQPHRLYAALAGVREASGTRGGWGGCTARFAPRGNLTVPPHPERIGCYPRFVNNSLTLRYVACYGRDNTYMAPIFYDTYMARIWHLYMVRSFF